MLPADASMAGLAAAFAAEAFLFYSHASTQDSPKAVTEHYYLVIGVLVTVGTCALELFLPHRPHLLLLRSWAVSFQGAWFVYVAATLDWQFPTPMSAPMMSSVFFCWVAFVVGGGGGARGQRRETGAS